MVPKSTLLFVLLALIGIQSAVAEEPCAVLLDCSPDVRVIRKDGTEIIGTFGIPLYEGDVVRTGLDAQADVHFENGGWFGLGSRSNLTIRPSRMEPRAKPAFSEKSFETVQNFLSIKDSDRTSSVARLRAAEPAGELRAKGPVETRVSTRRIVFRWHAEDTSARMHLTVSNDKGIIWEEDFIGTHDVTYPATETPLVPGVDYSWTVESLDPREIPPLRSKAAHFKVADAKVEKAVRSDLDELAKEKKKSQASYHLVRASIFYSYGLLDDAIMEMTTALRISTGNNVLKSILARLYAEVGRTEDALEMYSMLPEQQP